MKRFPLACLCLLLLPSCEFLGGGKAPLSRILTTHPNGTQVETVAPAQDPDKAAFNQLCQKVVGP